MFYKDKKENEPKNEKEGMSIGKIGLLIITSIFAVGGIAYFVLLRKNK